MTSTLTHAAHRAAGCTPSPPYLAVVDARASIAFYVAAFGAVRRGDPHVMPDGRIGHVEVGIGDTVLMLADEFPEIGLRAPVRPRRGEPVVAAGDRRPGRGRRRGGRGGRRAGAAGHRRAVRAGRRGRRPGRAPVDGLARGADGPSRRRGVRVAVGARRGPHPAVLRRGAGRARRAGHRGRGDADPDVLLRGGRRGRGRRGRPGRGRHRRRPAGRAARAHRRLRRRPGHPVRAAHRVLPAAAREPAGLRRAARSRRHAGAGVLRHRAGLGVRARERAGLLAPPPPRRRASRPRCSGSSAARPRRGWCRRSGWPTSPPRSPPSGPAGGEAADGDDPAAAPPASTTRAPPSTSTPEPRQASRHSCHGESTISP